MRFCYGFRSISVVLPVLLMVKLLMESEERRRRCPTALTRTPKEILYTRKAHWLEDQTFRHSSELERARVLSSPFLRFQFLCIEYHTKIPDNYYSFTGEFTPACCVCTGSPRLRMALNGLLAAGVLSERRVGAANTLLHLLFSSEKVSHSTATPSETGEPCREFPKCSPNLRTESCSCCWDIRAGASGHR